MISRVPLAMVAGAGATPDICSMVIAIFTTPLPDHGCANVSTINAQDGGSCKVYDHPRNADQ
jgi:hypothetical protein